MSIDADVARDLADDLLGALRTGEPVGPLTDEHELTIEDAYEIQSKFLERRLSDGASPVGYKVGLTNQGIQAQLGVDEPDFGRLLDTMELRDNTIDSSELIAPRIEPEIGFLLDTGLEPPVTRLDVLDATAGVTPVAEIIDSRVRNWNIQIQDTMADNASAGKFTTGGTMTDPSGIDLSLEGAKVWKNGTLADAGVGANVLGHPADAVSWLTKTLNQMGSQIKGGNLILSGSFTPAVDVRAGDSVMMEFTSLGSLTLGIV